MDINHEIDHELELQEAMTSFVDALYSRFADPKYSECNSCELFIIGSLSPGKSGKLFISFFLSFIPLCYAYIWNGKYKRKLSLVPDVHLHGKQFILL